MTFLRTALIILALLLGWTALRHQSAAHPDRREDERRLTCRREWGTPARAWRSKP